MGAKMGFLQPVLIDMAPLSWDLSYRLSVFDRYATSGDESMGREVDCHHVNPRCADTSVGAKGYGREQPRPKFAEALERSDQPVAVEIASGTLESLD